MKVFEKYNKLSKIGSGAFGVVYKAQNKINKELVAIKEIPIIQNDTNIKEDIERELKFMEIFNYSQNSVKLYEKFEENGIIYAIIELCDGDIPYFLKKTKNGFSITEIKIIMNQFNKILYEIRKKNMVHNDVKLDNLLVKFKTGKEFEIKLMDYGLSKLISSDKDLTNNQWGLKPYTEGGPEALYFIEKIDLFNIGGDIYIMLFNEKPKTLEEIMNKIDNNIKDEDLKDLLKKLFIIEPKKRIDWDDYFNHKFFKIEKEEFNNVEHIIKGI